MTTHCLVCNGPDLENCHWPEAVGNRKRKKHPELPVVPMCRVCHMRQHEGHGPTIERLIRKAPLYWRATGQWDKAMPYFERFMARREYLRKVAV